MPVSHPAPCRTSRTSLEAFATLARRKRRSLSAKGNAKVGPAPAPAFQACFRAIQGATVGKVGTPLGDFTQDFGGPQASSAGLDRHTTFQLASRASTT